MTTLPLHKFAPSEDNLISSLGEKLLPGRHLTSSRVEPFVASHTCDISVDTMNGEMAWFSLRLAVTSFISFRSSVVGTVPEGMTGILHRSHGKPIKDTAATNK